MRKWKRMSLLNKKLANSSLHKDEAGITLVELLAVLAIFSLVIMLAGSMHMLGQRQFIVQTESASQANDLSYALTTISTEVRKESASNVTVQDGSDIYVGESKLFYVEGGQLKQNGSVIADDVATMTAIKQKGDPKDENAEKDSLVVTLTSTSGKNYATTIYFRGGGSRDE